jgi:hypothetical protein
MQNVILALQWTLATAGALALTPVVGEIVMLLVASPARAQRRQS